MKTLADLHDALAAAGKRPDLVVHGYATMSRHTDGYVLREGSTGTWTVSYRQHGTEEGWRTYTSQDDAVVDLARILLGPDANSAPAVDTRVRQWTARYLDHLLWTAFILVTIAAVAYCEHWAPFWIATLQG